MIFLIKKGMIYHSKGCLYTKDKTVKYSNCTYTYKLDLSAVYLFLVQSYKKYILFNMKKLDIIFNLPITLMAILLVRLVTNKYQLSRTTNILTQSQIDSYRKNGILMMDWQIFTPDKLEEISTILISKVIPILIMSIL